MEQVTLCTFNEFKVHAWLNCDTALVRNPSTHPLAIDASTSCSTSAITPATSLKRKREPSLPHTSRKSLRREPLRETAMNTNSLNTTENDSSKGLPKGSKPKPGRHPSRDSVRSSPRKNTAPLPLRTIGEAIQPLGSDNEPDFDERGRLPTSSTAAIHPTAKYAQALQLSTDSLVLSPPQRSIKSSSSTHSRSTSPVKTMQDLAMADPPIKFVEANQETIKPSEQSHQLYTRILDACEGFKLLPSSLKSNIKLYYSQHEVRNINDAYFNKSQVPPRGPSDDEINTWNIVRRIRENARICSEDGDSEAGWGERVYSQIFEASLEHSPLKLNVGWKNITTARIDPKSLVPKHLSGKPLGSKMVDYSLFLRPDDATHQAILKVLRDLPEDDQNINHTRSTPVRYRPITVNIEVKVPGEGKNEAKVQLSIWVAALINKLNALAKKMIDIGLPLISVEGHDWRIHIAYQRENGEIIIWGNDLFGDTSSVLGVYRILAGIQLLADWSHTEYRAWFEENVLQ